MGLAIDSRADHGYSSTAGDQEPGKKLVRRVPSISATVSQRDARKRAKGMIFRGSKARRVPDLHDSGTSDRRRDMSEAIWRYWANAREPLNLAVVLTY
jgi:hypothetical protein